MLYSLETAELTKTQKKIRGGRNENARIRYETNVSRKDNIRTKSIRQTLGIEEKFTDKMRERLRWFGHVHRKGRRRRRRKRRGRRSSGRIGILVKKPQTNYRTNTK